MVEIGLLIFIMAISVVNTIILTWALSILIYLDNEIGRYKDI